MDISKNNFTFTLYSFNVKNNSLSNHGSPPGLSNIHKDETFIHYLQLLLDDEARIWVSDFGWYDTKIKDKDIWYKMLDTNLFIQHIEPDRLYEYDDYYAQPAFNIDNNIWFKGGGRIATLNLENGEWCLLSKGYFGLLYKDFDNNIWTTADRKLFIIPHYR